MTNNELMDEALGVIEDEMAILALEWEKATRLGVRSRLSMEISSLEKAKEAFSYKWAFENIMNMSVEEMKTILTQNQ